MSLTERHRWCAGKILEAFAPELASEQVHQFIRIDAVVQKFSQLFRGEGSGRLFIFYQPPIVEGVVSHFANRFFFFFLIC